MKKYYAFLVLGLIGFISNAQIVNIPDANFKAKLISTSNSGYIPSGYGTVDTNHNGEIEVSEALAMRTLDLEYANISSLSGIEAFTNLEGLKASSNQITTIDVSSLTNLRSLDCSMNLLTSLNTSGHATLSTVKCSNNNLVNIDVSYSHVISLDCNGNHVTQLNIAGLNLIYLDITHNELSSLDLSGCSQLTRLFASANLLTSLILPTISSLYYLNCNHNLLTNLTVTGGALQEMECQYNQLTTLTLSGLTSLNSLKCNNNNLPSLTISGNLNLSSLDCRYNSLTNLSLSNLPALYYLNCSNNLLPSLDLSGLRGLNDLTCHSNPPLTYLNIKNNKSEYYLAFASNPNLHYICADENEVFYIQDILEDYYMNSYCTVNSYCTFTPAGTVYNITGDNRFDEDMNGCNSTDNLVPFLRYNINSSSIYGSIYANSIGSYNLPVSAGGYTITPVLENPSYFAVTPSNTGDIIFPTSASPFVRNFCISPVGSNPDLEVAIYPQTDARPGFNNRFILVYKNKGNATQNGNVTFTYDDAIQDLVSTSVAPSTQTTGSLTWNFTNLLPFETKSILITFNLNTPTETPALNTGVVLHYTGAITSVLTDITPNDNTRTAVQTTTNSYDPNDKTCAEGTTIAPSMVGDYVHYVIRFENTGTANAQNIVVKDMIDPYRFDVSSLMPQSGSHPFATRIKDTNQVEFVFENINLPFDDATNDGYVAFKIKTKPTLVLGNTFSNTANIYFDYNFPIVTNTYTTTVAALGNQDFEFNSVFSLSPVPTKDRLTISTKQDVVMSSISIYNTLGQLVQISTNPSDTIDVSSLKTGSYFIKIVSDKGSATGKFIKE